MYTHIYIYWVGGGGTTPTTLFPQQYTVHFTFNSRIHARAHTHLLLAARKPMPFARCTTFGCR